MSRTWNKFYNKHDRFYLLPHPEIDKALSLFKETGASNILDLGCGSGRHLVEIAKHGFQVTGVDYSPSAAHLAEEWLKDYDLHGKVFIGDFRNDLKGFRQDEFDGLVCIDSVQYLKDKFELEDVIAEVNRVLKPESIAFFVIPSKSTVILQPDVGQVFFEREILETLFSSCFEILDFYEDSKKSWVIIAKNRRNISVTEESEV